MEQNQLILLTSMILSGIVVLAYNKLIQLNRKRYLKSAMKRYKIIREKEDRGEIKRRVVYFEENARVNGEEIEGVLLTDCKDIDEAVNEPLV